MLIEMANILLSERDLTKISPKIRVKWVNAFLKGNLDINVKFARRLANSQALCEDLVIIGGFFEQLLQHKKISITLIK